MNKKVLAICYSQTGQLAEIIGKLTAPMLEAGIIVETLQVQAQPGYPFPWEAKTFMAQMPDCVMGIGKDLQPFRLKEEKYDLVILGYQAWFLSPSIPTNSILNHPDIQAVIKDTPVITVTGARNMWINAMERIKKRLQELNGRLVGHIALVDKHSNYTSLVTICHWMFNGRKDRYLNIFPKPGVADEDIAHASVFGSAIIPYLQKNEWGGLQDTLLNEGAVEVKYNLMFIESKGKKIFAIWAKLIANRENKVPWLVAFKYYLLIALFIAAPIILTVNNIFFRPFLSARIRKQMKYYAGINFNS